MLVKCLYTDVNRSFIHKSPKTSKQTEICPSAGENVGNVCYILVSLRNNETEWLKLKIYCTYWNRLNSNGYIRAIQFAWNLRNSKTMGQEWALRIVYERQVWPQNGLREVFRMMELFYVLIWWWWFPNSMHSSFIELYNLKGVNSTVCILYLET